jgi:hypothetical protein
MKEKSACPAGPAEYVAEVVLRNRTRVPGHPGIGPGPRSPSNYHITYGHEAAAKAARRAKKPSRIGMFVLRLLGYRGSAPHVPDAHDRPDPRHL